MDQMYHYTLALKRFPTQPNPTLGELLHTHLTVHMLGTGWEQKCELGLQLLLYSV